MDPEVARLCWEFLLRKLGGASTQTLIKKLQHVIPLPDSDSRLKRIVLLRTLQDDVSKASITEAMLARLEVLEELHRELGSSVTAAMGAAYCAIAVECTVKYLEFEASPNNTAYIDAVERIWRSRAIHMEPSASGGGGGGLLFSPDLKNWSCEIEASLVNPQVMERLANMNSRRNAIQKLKAFLAESWEDLGPSSLELVASCPTTSTSNKGLTGVCEPSCSRTDVVAVEGSRSTAHQERVTPVEEIQHDNQLLEDNGTTCIGTSNQITLVADHILCLSTCQEREIQEDNQRLEGNCATMSTEEVDLSAIENQTTDAELPDSPVCHNIRNNELKDSMDNLLEAPSDITVTDAQIPNLPLLKDSIDNLHEGASNDAGRFHLPSPKRKKMSPLKKYEQENLTKRRKLKKWSALEEETLRTAVNKTGEGNWKLILNSHKDIFKERTQVDLKDKWRNLRRYGGK